jgi:hypothetical protein
MADHDLQLGKAVEHAAQTMRSTWAFLFRLISTLQFSGTVPMIDIQAYAQWLLR